MTDKGGNALCLGCSHNERLLAVPDVLQGVGKGEVVSLYLRTVLANGDVMSIVASDEDGPIQDLLLIMELARNAILSVLDDPTDLLYGEGGVDGPA